MGVVILPSTLTNGTVADATQVMADLNAILAAVNGNLDATNLLAGGVTQSRLAKPSVGTPELIDASVTDAKLSAALLAALGLVGGGVIQRGRASVPAEEARADAAYGLLGTPDRVQNINVPANSLVRIHYRALWKESNADTARAAIFIGANQLKVRYPTQAAPVTQAAICGVAVNNPNVYRPLRSFPCGLAGVYSDATAHGSDVATGQAAAIAGNRAGNDIFMHEVNGVRVEPFREATGGMSAGYVGGACEIVNLAGGTYDFSVQFKASAGAVTVKERELLIEVVKF